VTREVSGAAEFKIAGYVLAGGGSTRFGRDKALVEMDGKPMLLYMCELLAGVVSGVKIVASSEKYASFGIETVADLWPGEGPLGGIITALLETESSAPPCKWNLIVSCDMPFLTREWIHFLVEHARISSAQVVVPQSERGLEPLCSCWRTDRAATLRTMFENGVRKVTDVLKHLESEVLDAKDWQSFDCAERLFWNMNTAADYDEARRIRETETK
jgi:molybdopterin-guanine dinucleotide biosynthesis protein A